MSIHIQGVTKRFPTKHSDNPLLVIDNIDIRVPDGSIVSLFGPNGSGKTTLLNIIAGIETLDSGRISITDSNETRSQVGYVFQNFRDVLLPWETALDNASFGLRAMGVSRPVALKQTLSFLERHNIVFPHENYPYQLSVGQQQTVAIARTLIQQPANILLDEPFTALDHEARFRMQAVVASVIKELPTAIVFVSHDIDEALYMSDEVVLLSKRPAQVINRFSVPFGRPRPPELLATAKFATLRREVVAAFLKEIRV